jgi:hypothetical protein
MPSFAGPTDPEGGVRVFCAGTRSETAALVEFVDGHRDRFGVEPICAVLDFRSSTYYAAKKREYVQSARAVLEDLPHGGGGDL